MRKVGGSRRLDSKSLLIEARNGDGKAVDQLKSLVHTGLRRIVRGVLVSEGHQHALEPARVINECFLSLVRSRDKRLPPNMETSLDWKSRAYFLAIASHQMRLVLAAFERHRGNLMINVRQLTDGANMTIHKVEVIEELLQHSGRTDPARERVLEMDCLGGMTDREIALVEHSSTGSAKRDRDLARRWLADMTRSKI